MADIPRCIQKSTLKWLGFVALTLGLAAAQARAADENYLVYFGTYTKEKSHGIYVAHFNAVTGELSATALAVAAANPSFLALHPNRRFLYSVGNADQPAEKPPGVVKAFAIDRATGKLAFLNEQTAGTVATTEVSVDQTGRNVITESYNEGFVSVFSLRADGTVGPRTDSIAYTGSGPNKERQAGPHPHSANLDAASRFVIVPDLGTDKLMTYRLDAEHGKLLPNDPPFVMAHPGAGPRHLAFHPSGHYAYVITEMAATVTAYTYDGETAHLGEIQDVPTLPADFTKPNRAAEVIVHPSGKFLYASNRGHDTIAVFAIDQKTGRLTFVERQGDGIKFPRGFAIDPTGHWLICANFEADNATVYRIDLATGKLLPTGQAVPVPQSICVRFLAP